MKVLFNQSISGADFYYLRGQVVELPAATAQRYIDAKFCEPVAEKQSVKAERAVSKRTTKRNTRAK